MASEQTLLYLMQRDLRILDNRVFHHLATSKNHGFTHFLPVFIWNSRQVETSGLLKPGETSPYPEARSRIGQFWRTGPHRISFTAQAVWNVKESLESLGSGLIQRAGLPVDVLSHLIEHYKKQGSAIGAVWMTAEAASEEIQDQRAIQALCADQNVDFMVWTDEKYLIDADDTGLKTPQDLPDIFSTYFKSLKPLRDKPRPTLPRPKKSSLPPMPNSASVPPQNHPFVMPDTLEALTARLLDPLQQCFSKQGSLPPGTVSAHPFSGGEDAGLERMRHLIKTGAMTTYDQTRNGLLDTDCSTKLSAYLAHGCITARQVHAELLKLEDGADEQYAGAPGYGAGESAGTAAVRYELLWRDYMHLCTRKFGKKLFHLDGFKEGSGYQREWITSNQNEAKPTQNPSPERVAHMIKRFIQGTTGLGLIDASQRELFQTGYTSNRARQNVASFFAKQLGIDWRFGAEWYESLLVDYDVSSNWANWQYVAGVGNDPREARVFNPVKQAFDYDSKGDYVRAWMPELRPLANLENVFQVSTTSSDELHKSGLAGLLMVTEPLKRIQFTLAQKKKKKKKKNQQQQHGRGNHQQQDSSHRHSSSMTNGHRGYASSSSNSRFSQPDYLDANYAAHQNADNANALKYDFQHMSFGPYHQGTPSPYSVFPYVANPYCNYCNYGSPHTHSMLPPGPPVQHLELDYSGRVRWQGPTQN